VNTTLPSTLVCIGDSITEAGFAPLGWATLLRASLATRSHGPWKLVNAGVSGRHSGEMLDRLNELVLPHLPAVALINLGVNDAYHQAWQQIPRVSLGEFRRNLTEMVRILRARNSVPVLVVGHALRDSGIFVQGNGRPQPENFAPYQAAIRPLAAELMCACIDLPALAAEAGEQPDAFVREGDGVHLSPAGQALYARLLEVGLDDAGLLH